MSWMLCPNFTGSPGRVCAAASAPCIMVAREIWKGVGGVWRGVWEVCGEVW